MDGYDHCFRIWFSCCYVLNKCHYIYGNTVASSQKYITIIKFWCYECTVWTKIYAPWTIYNWGGGIMTKEIKPWARHQTSVWLNKCIIKSCSCVCMLLLRLKGQAHLNTSEMVRKHMKQSKAMLCWHVSELIVIKESLRIYRKTEPNETTRFTPKQEIWKPEEQQHVYECTQHSIKQ